MPLRSTLGLARATCLLSILACAACAQTVDPSTAPESAAVLTLVPGAGAFEYRDTRGNAGRPITVRYHLPDNFETDGPIVFVMHGASRAGQRYFDDWQPEAQARGFLLLVPEFGDASYPGSVWYNLGNVFGSEEPGPLRPEEEWTFTAIEHLFEDARSAIGGSQQRFRLYGHSAGSQFAHRFLFLRPTAPVERAVLANAGWYTLPVDTIRWPYGLDESPATSSSVSARLGASIIVLLGDQDTDTAQSNLRNTPEARAQGPHRFARGHTFYAVAQAEAARRGVPFGWRLDTVPGAHHNNALMTPDAAEALFR